MPEKYRIITRQFGGPHNAPFEQESWRHDREPSQEDLERTIRDLKLDKEIGLDTIGFMQRERQLRLSGRKLLGLAGIGMWEDLLQLTADDKITNLKTKEVKQLDAVAG